MPKNHYKNRLRSPSTRFLSPFSLFKSVRTLRTHSSQNTHTIPTIISQPHHLPSCRLRHPPYHPSCGEAAHIYPKIMARWPIFRRRVYFFCFYFSVGIAVVICLFCITNFICLLQLLFHELYPFVLLTKGRCFCTQQG